MVRADIRALKRVLARPDAIEEWPRLRSSAARPDAVPPPSRRDPVPPASAAPEPAPAAGPAAELFGRTARSPAPDRRPAAPEPPAPKKKPAANDQRFANYFSTGNFLGAGPADQDKSIQRNKAIFMSVVVVAVFVWVFYLIFR